MSALVQIGLGVLGMAIGAGIIVGWSWLRDRREHQRRKNQADWWRVNRNWSR